MVERLKPDELAAFKEAFDSFDRNNDGTIGTKVKCILVFKGKFDYIFNSYYMQRGDNRRFRLNLNDRFNS